MPISDADRSLQIDESGGMLFPLQLGQYLEKNHSRVSVASSDPVETGASEGWDSCSS